MGRKGIEEDRREWEDRERRGEGTEGKEGPSSRTEASKLCGNAGRSAAVTGG